MTTKNEYGEKINDSFNQMNEIETPKKKKKYNILLRCRDEKETEKCSLQRKNEE